MQLNKYMRHVIELCLTNGIFPLPINDVMFSNASAFANRVEIKPPENWVEYAVALHEIGHCMEKPNLDLKQVKEKILFFKGQGLSEKEILAQTSKYIDSIRTREVKLQDEIRAWNWAQSNALEWTPDMEAAREYGINSHVRNGIDTDGAVARMRGILKQSARFVPEN